MDEFILEWLDSAGKTHRYLCAGGTLLIGRLPSCDLVLPFPFISSKHARITRDGNGLTIEDLESTNGSFINETLVTRARLHAGDRLRLGSLDVTVQLPGQRPPPSPPPKAHGTRPVDALLEFTTMMPGAVAGGSELEKLSVLLDFQAQWGRSFSAESMFQQIVRSALQVSQAERGYILLHGEDGLDYALGMDEQERLLDEEEFRASRTVVDLVVERGEPEFRTEGVGGELAMAESIMAMNTHALACLPLMRLADEDGKREVLGVLYLDSTRVMHGLSGLDKKILGKLAGEAAGVLEKIEMIESLEEKRQLERELDLARETQRGLLPQSLPDIAGYSLRAFCRPTRQVGGDLYDFVTLADGSLVGALADVSGKGVAASLVSSSVQGALQTLFRRGLEMHEVLQEINLYLCERSEESRFVTLFVFQLSADGKCSFISAGHNPSYLYRAQTGAIEELSSGGLIIGAFDFARYAAKEFQLEKGDALLVYSDGLTDATGPDESFFGEERVQELLVERSADGVDAVEAAIFDALDAHTQGVDQTDDITFILLQRDSVDPS